MSHNKNESAQEVDSMSSTDACQIVATTGQSLSTVNTPV
jgi:hypothetical protein